MIIAFLESMKYLGHLWPVALLRIFVGYFFLASGIEKIHQNFLNSPILQDLVQKWIQTPDLNPQYIHFLQTWVLPHWQTFSYLVVFAELAVGVSFIIGFMVRISSILAIFLSVNFILAAGPAAETLNRLLIAVNAMFFLISAGRCFGFDYYFYKKIRGFWW